MCWESASDLVLKLQLVKPANQARSKARQITRLIILSEDNNAASNIKDIGVELP